MFDDPRPTNPPATRAEIWRGNIVMGMVFLLMLALLLRNASLPRSLTSDASWVYLDVTPAEVAPPAPASAGERYWTLEYRPEDNAWLYLQGSTLYLHDHTRSTPMALFDLRTDCQLVWTDGQQQGRAWLWEISSTEVPLGLPSDSRAVMSFYAPTGVYIVQGLSPQVILNAESGSLTLYPDCARLEELTPPIVP